MTSAAKRHRLTFRLEHLEPVKSGAKCCTVRLSKRTAAIRSGDRLVLAFGRYDQPTVLEATAARVEHLDLSDELAGTAEADLDLKGVFSPPPSVTSSTATTEHEILSTLREALRDSGGNYDDLLAEMADKRESTVTCVWWSPMA